MLDRGQGSCEVGDLTTREEAPPGQVELGVEAGVGVLDGEPDESRRRERGEGDEQSPLGARYASRINDSEIVDLCVAPRQGRQGAAQ